MYIAYNIYNYTCVEAMDVLSIAKQQAEAKKGSGRGGRGADERD